jgi:hypothetical protein
MFEKDIKNLKENNLIEFKKKKEFTLKTQILHMMLQWIASVHILLKTLQNLNIFYITSFN